jgi:hypothetical protein
MCDSSDDSKFLIFFRRILHEIKILRAQLKHQSLDHIARNSYHTYSDRDVFSPIERRYLQTSPNQHSNLRYELSSYPFNHFHQMRRTGSVETTKKNPYFEHELRTLITLKHQLESRIYQLQLSREQLTSQLDNLEQGLRYSPHLQQRSTTSSPYGRSSISPSRMNYSKNTSIRSYSTPTTPVHNRSTNHCMD